VRAGLRRKHRCSAAELVWCIGRWELRAYNVSPTGVLQARAARGCRDESVHVWGAGTGKEVRPARAFRGPHHSRCSLTLQHCAAVPSLRPACSPAAAPHEYILYGSAHTLGSAFLPPALACALLLTAS